MIRPFELSDIPTLHKYRQQGLFLDSVLTLTWGQTLVPAGAALSLFSAAMGVFTSISLDEENGIEPVIGQVTHSVGSPFASFTFLAPDRALDSPALSPLLENLIQQVGKRGAQHLLAEVDEETQTFESLRVANFSIYSRQRIWRVSKRIKAEGESGWRAAASIDEINVRKLYNGVVPVLVQQVEPVPWGRLKGWVYYQGSDLLAFAAVAAGPKGIWVQPFIHPEMEEVPLRIKELAALLQPRAKRPVYFCLRSYTAWLEQVLEDIEAEPGPPQAVMVRRMTAAIKKPALAPITQTNGITEPTTTYYENPPEKANSR